MAEKTSKSRIKIELTPEQREQIRQATGKEVSALEILAEELEERIAPIFAVYSGGGPITKPSL